VAEAKVATDVLIFWHGWEIPGQAALRGERSRRWAHETLEIFWCRVIEIHLHMSGRHWSLSLARVISPHLAASRSRAFWECLFRLGIECSTRRLKCIFFDLGREKWNAWEKIQSCGKRVLFMGFLPKKNSFEILINIRGNPSCSLWGIHAGGVHRGNPRYQPSS
jgi:hypothetical protein